jgi:hypothetical protein
MIDCVTDIHGCIEEFREILGKLGYAYVDGVWKHPTRKLVVLGDLVDRGPDSLSVVREVMAMCKAGTAHCVIGNHDDKFLRFLKGNKVKPSHGLDGTIKQFETVSQEFRDDVRDWLGSLPYQMFLDNGRVLVAHAGLPEKMHGIESGRVRSHALYGDVSGEVDAAGLPVRKDWAKNYTGTRIVIHGHTPMKDVRVLNNVICIDTGAPFGGFLTAMRYPEMEFVQVKAKAAYQPFHSFANDNAGV